MNRRRRFLIPEVVQSSNMDCGPAALSALLRGFGVHASYGRLREACQTDVDGTSIDTIEDVAVRLGLDAEQMLLPLDYLLHPKCRILPALLVVQLPGGLVHFVVVWRRLGRVLQVMDPAIGRRWFAEDRFLESVYVHTARVPPSTWREWAASDSAIAILESRLADAGVRPERFLHSALEDPGWRGLAALDAGCRAVAALRRAGALEKAEVATHVLQRLLEEPERIDPEYWSVEPSGTNEIAVRGAVLIHVRGLREPVADRETLGAELRAALQERPSSPVRQLWRIVREGGLLAPGVAGAGLVLGAIGTVVEAVLLRGMLDLGWRLPVAGQRVAAMAALIVFLLLLLLLDMRLATIVTGLGRHLEIRVRLAFLRKIPKLGDRYFQSRLRSDMAERSHTLHRLRAVPELAARLVRASAEAVFTAAAIFWIDPSAAPAAACAALCAIGLPLLMQPVLTEGDLRVKTHTGALCRFYLDALLGLSPIRAHGGERAVRGEHARLLGEWARAALSLQRTVVRVEAVQLILLLGCTAVAMFGYASSGSDPARLLLLVYWLLNFPALGEEVAQVAAQYPSCRNTTLRVLEPLGALEQVAPRPAERGKRGSRHAGAAITVNRLAVVAGGHTILQDIDVHVAAGSHVAIVGASGAGKSSLVGVLLGWHQPAHGNVLVDGVPITECLEDLRRETAWADPSVQLWNRPLNDNLLYGSTDESVGIAATPIEVAGLLNVIQKLSDGMETKLGESGALVSGGEGQRVRLARALGKSSVRLVILDEPFRGLDAAERLRLLDEARRTWRHATLLFITHDISHTSRFDRVLVLESGRLVEDGRPAHLAATAGSTYRAMLESERSAHRRMWTDGRWRRIRLEQGELRGEAAARAFA